MTIMYVVVYGNPIDGIAIHGTFNTSEKANDYADRCSTSSDEWWITDIFDPQEEE